MSFDFPFGRLFRVRIFVTLTFIDKTRQFLAYKHTSTSRGEQVGVGEGGLNIWLTEEEFPPSTGLLNFLSNVLHVVALMSVFSLSFVLTILSNVFRRGK